MLSSSSRKAKKSSGKDLTYRIVLTLYMIFVYASLASFMRSYPHAACSSGSSSGGGTR